MRIGLSLSLTQPRQSAGTVITGPVNSVAPVATSNATLSLPLKGDILTCNGGTWAGTPTLAYQWKRASDNGNATGSGAATSAYTIVSRDLDDTLYCVVTATDINGSTVVNSNASGSVAAFNDLKCWSADGRWVYSILHPLAASSVFHIKVTGGTGWPATIYRADSTFANFAVGEASNQNIVHLPGLDGTVRSGGRGWQLSSGTINKKLICDGNSLMAGDGSQAGIVFGWRILSYLDDTWEHVNKAVSGQTTAQMISDAATEIDPLYDSGRTVNLLCALEGTNSIYFGASAAATIADLQTYLTGRKAAHPGLITGPCTIMPRSDSPPGGFEASRTTVNAWLRDPARIGVDFDLLFDLAANSHLGVSGAELDTDYFSSDKVHWNDGGRALGAQIIASRMKAYLG